MDVIIKNSYNKILNRDPDDDGMSAYTEHMKKPTFDPKKVLRNSDEYKERIGTKNNQRVHVRQK